MARQSSPLAIGSVRPAVIGLGRILGMGVTSVMGAPLSTRGHGGGEEPGAGGTPLWILAIASLALTLIGGVFAGLTIALVSLERASSIGDANHFTA